MMVISFFVNSIGMKHVTFSFLMSLMLISCKQGISVYINPVKIIEAYHGSAPRRQELAQKNQAWQANLEALSKELEALPAGKRAAKEQEFLRYRDAVQQQAQAENVRLQQAVLVEINAYIKQYGKEHGYQFIFGATDQGNIVYAAEGTDITEEVLKSLNEQYDAQHPTGR